MKLAIVSDMHIGYERFEEDAYRQAREALEKAAEMADVILIPGDVFDKRSPKPEVIAQAINIFRDLSRRKWKASVAELRTDTENRMFTNVPIIAIPGTHERTAEGKDNVLKLLALAGLMVDASESTAVVECDGEKVAICGLGGVSEERVMECIKKLDPKPVQGMFNVFMIHQSIYEILPFSDDFIKYSDLPKGFDLYVNGHIHSRVEATAHGKKFLIPGSTVLTQLKEGEQESKGFIIFDTKTGNHKFEQISSRPFICTRIKLSDATPKQVVEKAEEAIEHALKGKEKPIIKLIFDGTIAKGYAGSDMQLRNLLSRYSSKAILDFDTSKMKSPDLEREIEDIRGGNLSGLSIKEIGAATFASKLKEHKYEGGVDAVRLFEVLSKDGSKEKVIKEAAELLDTEK